MRKAKARKIVRFKKAMLAASHVVHSVVERLSVAFICLRDRSSALRDFKAAIFSALPLATFVLEAVFSNTNASDMVQENDKQ